MYPNTDKLTTVLLATYADAVAPQADFIADVGPLYANSSEFNLCLQPRCTIDLRPMNDKGDLGAVFVFL